MDKQGRLTQEREWIVGRLYRWKKGRHVSMEKLYRCVEVSLSLSSPGGNNRSGTVTLDSGDGGILYFAEQWRNRFVPWA